MVAPMVRVSSLAFRLLCGGLGATAAFSEEIVAAKLAKAIREEVIYDVPKHLVPPFAPPGELPLPALIQAFDLKKVGGSTEEADEECAKRFRGTTPVHVVEFVVYENYRNMRKRQVVFSTINRRAHPFAEGSKVIVQLGINDPVMGAAAARVVAADVDGIDVNMGCPKKFSVENGMGAALMKEPEKAGRILAIVFSAINSTEERERRGGRWLPLSFKTRVFSDPRDTEKMLTCILRHCGHQESGQPVVHAITLHARTRDQRSETTPLVEAARAAVELCISGDHKHLYRNMCFVFNGSVAGMRDAVSRKLHSEPSDTPGVSPCFGGFLVARHAMWDPSVFAAGRTWPLLTDGPMEDPASAAAHVERARTMYRIMLAMHRFWQTNFMYVKYHVTRSWQEFPDGKKVCHSRLQMARSYGEFARIFGFSSSIADTFFSTITFEELMKGEIAPGNSTASSINADDSESLPTDEPPQKLPRCELVP